MRLDPVLDSFYVLGSLWGSVTSPQVCRASPAVRSATVREVIPAPVPRPAAAVTAFVDVNVIPMNTDTERVLANQTVLVTGGKITALGPSGKVTVPAGAVRVDGRDKYLVPGLAEMHRHWVPFDTMDLFNSLASGVTGARILLEGTTYSYWLPEGQGLSRFLRPADSVRISGIPLPHLYLPPHIPLSTRLDSVAAVVAAAKAAGYEFIEMPGNVNALFEDDFERLLKQLGSQALTAAKVQTLPRALFDSVLVAARRVGLPVATHHHTLPFDGILALGTGGSAEHLDGMVLDTFGWQTPPGDLAAALAPKRGVPLATIRRIAATLRRSGVWLTPTLRCDRSADSTQRKVMRQLVQALRDEGVGMLLSADDGWSVHDELAEMVGAGLSPYQALRTGTYNVARYFGQLNERGTVAVGKRADLVLLAGNPLQDIRYTREPAGVMIGGRWLDRAELDRRLLAGTYTTYHELKSGGGSGTRFPWLVASVNHRGINTRDRHLQGTLRTIAALTDSLAAVPPADKRAYEPPMRRLAEALGALRALLKPEQQVIFDPIARVWLREQGRRGYQVTVPGVTPVP